MWWQRHDCIVMRRLYYLFLPVLCLSLQAQAQVHALQYGARGGMVFGVGSEGAESRTALGATGGIDMGYTFYTPVHMLDIGVHTGLSFGYSQLSMRPVLHEQFTNTDYLGNAMHYTVTGHVALHQRDVFCEVPVMFALRSSDGLVFHVGAKLRPSVWRRQEQTLSDVVIDAYYPLTDVHITNELITGLLSEEEQRQTAVGTMSALSVLAGLELGYEWELDKSNAIGFRLFADCMVWNTASRADAAPLISVSAISDPANPVPKVTVSNTAARQIGHLYPVECGITLYGVLFRREHKHWHRRW